MLKAAQQTSRQIREAESQAVRTKVLNFRLDTARRDLAIKEQKVEMQKRLAEQNAARREMEQNWKEQIEADKLRKTTEIQQMKREIKEKLHAKSDPAIISQKRQNFRRQKEIDDYNSAVSKYFQMCDEISVINNKRQFEAQKLRQLKSILETEEQQQRQITRIRNAEMEFNFGVGGELSRKLQKEEDRQAHVRSQLQQVKYSATLTEMKLKKAQGHK